MQLASAIRAPLVGKNAFSGSQKIMLIDPSESVVNRPGWAPSKYSVICSKHFNNADTAQIHLFKFAVPILRSSPEYQSVLAGNNFILHFYFI